MANVVVVDDDPAIHELLRVFLCSAGHEVSSAETPVELDALLDAGDVDLILLDINLPGLKGDQVASELKARHADLKVVLYSGTREAQLQDLAREAGADGYIQKGVDPQTLVQNVNRFLST